jgi:polyhydroxybutyrate depolymerase
VVPLVFDIHGAGSNGTEQEVYSAFSTKADSEGFVVVYPEGLPPTNTHFNAWMLPSPQPDDVAFMKAALDAVEAELCIDQSRVYSTGISNGAMMSIRLACSLSARIAAIAPVAGAYYPPDALNLNPAETCSDTGSMPVMAFHGTADAYVPFNGGVGTGTAGLNFRLPVDDNTPAEDVMSDWSIHDSCTGSRSESTVSSEVRFIEYGNCAGGAQVQLYAVDGGGHTWPGAFDVPSLGYTTHQINATDLIWSFFATHSKADADADSLPDGLDNCPADFNPDQVITRRGVIDLHPFGKLFDDTTYLNATVFGDSCNPEIDGDGFTNDVEAALGPGGASHGMCPTASANTDPLKLDTDGDGFVDRAECMLGFDPADSPSKPPTFYVGGDTDGDMLPDALEQTLGTDPTKTDTDGDKLNDGVEFLQYGSDPTNSNTDGDICNDGKEAASLNNDTKVNSTDQLIVAQSFGPIGAPKYVADFDVNKDRNINSTDMLIQAKDYGAC